jgi:hypothetical protein
VSPSGDALPAGELVTLAAQETVWLPDALVQRGLPVEIVDNRPGGFLGRHFAAQHAELGLPSRLEDWSDHHILVALVRRGEDLTGNLIVGDESFTRWQTFEAPSVTRNDYPRLAAETIAGQPPGSSAGGERPKFGACVEGQHRLIKFAARGTQNNAASRRWFDLLVLESIALDVILAAGIPAARNRLIETDTHAFLETDRFDRVGLRGRRAVVSLAGFHDDLVDTWTQAATRLLASGRVSAEDARRLRWLDAFGSLIGNTDRHQRNIVFLVDDGRAELAPAFDQLPMLYAPSADGQVPIRDFIRPHPTPDQLDVWDDAARAAADFWQRAGDEARLSDAMRRTADTIRRNL